MANTISLRVLTAESTVYEGEPTFIRIPGVEGDFGVLPGHSAVMTMMRTGECKIQEGLNDVYVFVSGGFVEVTGSHVVILADVAERVENIDPKKVEEARKQAQEALERNERDTGAAMSLERALFQLKVADLHQHRRSGSGQDLGSHLQDGSDE